MAILVGTLLAWYVFVPYLTSVITPAEGQSAAAFAKAIWLRKSASSVPAASVSPLSGP